jgi:hypothetical protein
VILVEGADGSGKTTLVEAICEHFKLEEGIRGTSDRDKLYEVTRRDTHTALALAVECSLAPRVWDRLFYSDFVYAPVTGRPVAFPREEAEFVQDIIEVLMPPLIICHPPLRVIEENLQGKQMEGVRENIAAIHNAYKKIFGVGGKFGGMGQTGAMWYDYTGNFPNVGPHTPWTNDVNVVFDHIEEYLDARKERQAWTT